MPDYCVIDNIFALMRSKKLITAFLILVLVLQLLPVRQAVRYFWIDNITTEEIIHINKGATKKFSQLDEDHKCMPNLNYILPQFAFIQDIPVLHLKEKLLVYHTADIQTQPPNKA